MKDLKTPLLRHHQRESLQADIANFDKMLPHAKDEDRAALIARKARTQRQLESQSPEPLTANEKDKLFKLEKRLREKITTNMPTAEVMRKNPAGAVDWHQKWEKANKSAINIWKNIKIQLNPDSQDRDLANLERYRPSGAVDRFRSDAQIPGVISFTGITDEEWPFEPPQNTALAQAQQHYDDAQAENDVNAAIDKLDAEPIEEEKGFGPSGTLSAEEYARLEDNLRKGREALAKKRAAAKQVQDIAEELPNVVAHEA